VENKWDPQWQIKWRDIYSQKLRSIPWYSVYGNHDLHKDPCSCSDDVSECAQTNWDITDLNYFYMPGLSWVKEHAELELEVVALEMNHFMWGWKKDAKKDQQKAWDCEWTPCPEKCEQLMEIRANQSFDLFYDRARNSPAKNLLVFSHYPTDYFSASQQGLDFLAELSNAQTHHIEYFAGHRHNTDQTSTWQIKPNNNWLVGGGGGWGCEGYGREQGIVVGEIAADGTIETYSVLVDADECCQLR